ncbi:MAG: hypothetical protein FJ220_04605, partial [Kiritimatiellaceae bacterium]|nr:hypothetical protein [Kiritimatiellaceae bacterium]
MEELVVKKIFLVFILLLWTVQSMAQPLSQDNAIQQMRAWMNGHRIMGHLVEAPLKSVQTFSSTTNDYFVYIAQFEPSGYVILNSDDQLPLIITFSADTTLNLDNTPDNALLSLLTQMVNRTIIPVAKKTLSAQKEMTPPESELYGPFLTTTWNQTHPYNAHCPSYPGGSVEYGYRAPSGCVPTAYAQILAFHRWPVTGRGFHTYTDSIGSMTGQHTAVFSDPYDWPSMKHE